MIAIVDLDGTLADNSHRLHYIRKHELFNEMFPKTKPIMVPIPQSRTYIEPLKLSEETVSEYINRLTDVEKTKFYNELTERWKLFYKSCTKDKPIYPMIYLVQCLNNLGHSIIILTGRSDISINETKKWLKEYEIEYTNLYMRTDGDYSSDIALKEKWLNDISSWVDDEIIVLEDRQSLVDWWKSKGFMVIQPHIPTINNNY